MNLVIVPAALAELQAAAAFYAIKANVDTARALVDEFERAVNLLLLNPHLGSRFRGARRRYPLRRFPYSVIYQRTADELRVVALAHQRRRPNYWRDRK
jgi:toxin ParE1/3/4